MTALWFALFISGAPVQTGGALLHPELCEASAAIRLDDGEFLVADNEQHDRLFCAQMAGPARVAHCGVVEMPKKDRPRDIEALARDGTTLAVVGSFSRRKDCSVQDKRMRIRFVQLQSDAPAVAPRTAPPAKKQPPPQRVHTLEADSVIDGSAVLALAHQSLASCLGSLFVGPPPPGAFAVCAALADQGDCPLTNIEGAVYDDSHRLWLGLRAPLVGDNAVLLRLADDARESGTLRFDAVVEVALGGHGVRELVHSGDDLLIIAGPPEDTVDPVAFQLHMLNRRQTLVPGARINSFTALRRTRRLPPSTEALLVDGDVAWGITDGDGNNGKCKTTSRVTRIPDATR